MSAKALKTLCGFFALFCLTFSTLAFLRRNGTKPSEDAFGFLGFEPAELPALALPMQLVLMALVLWLTHVWCDSRGGTLWATRVPVFYFEADDVDAASTGGRTYQAATIGLFLVVPFIFLVIMGVYYLQAPIYYNVTHVSEAERITRVGPFDIGGLYAAAKDRPGFFRFGAQDGVQYYPAMTWVYAAGVLAVTGYLLQLLFRIFRSADR